MRKARRPLDALFPRTRQRVLSATLMQPGRWWYLSDLAKELDLTPSSLQREVAGLVQAGVLRSRREGNRLYFQADPQCALFPELQGLVAKTVGLADSLREALRPLSRSIRVAFVFGSVARREERGASDVDLMVVGGASLSSLAAALKRAENRLGRAVNATGYTPEEFARKARSGHHFVRQVMQGEKLFIIGGTDDLEAAPGR